LLADEASSAAIVKVAPEAVVFIPSPARNSNVPPKLTEPAVELSSVNEIDEFVKLVLPMLDKVLLAPLIVLLVRVCVPVKVATVLSMANVTALPEPEVSIPVPPVNVKVSLSKSILNAPPESA